MKEERQKKTILITDDDEGIVMLLCLLCEEQGYQTIKAANGLEAVQKAVQFLPDLIVIDGTMPVMNGFEATAEITADERTKHIPVIMLTGMKTREDRLRGISAGASDLLTKPVDAEEFALRLRNNLKIKEYHDFLHNHARILEEQVQERTADIRTALDKLRFTHSLVNQSYIDTVFRLAFISEFKDEDTRSHIRRIGKYTREIAEQLGMDAQYSDTIAHASMLHDIGKVGIPDAILYKKGVLTFDEWKITKEHPRQGAIILSGSSSPSLSMAEQIASFHHERWDGTGYPSGLKGEAIALSGRITAIADQYDALRVKRSYKPAYTHSETMKIITAGDGRTLPEHFDPAVLEAFSSHEKKFEELFEQQAKE